MEMNTNSNQTNLEYLEVTFGGNKVALNKILNSFLTNTTQLMKDLFVNYDAENWGEVKMIAHKMKSSFNTVGAKDIGHTLEEIEQSAIEGGDKSNIPVLISNVKILGTKAFKEIEEKLN